MPNSYKPEGNTLCYDCRRNIMDCPWLHEELPVPGWTAEAVRLRVGYEGGQEQIVDTYRIRACPLRVTGRRNRSGTKQTQSRRERVHGKTQINGQAG